MGPSALTLARLVLALGRLLLPQLLLVLWRDRFFDNVKEKIVSSTLSLIDRNRHGDSSGTQLIKTLVGSFVTLSGIEKDKMKLYKSVFEDPFMEASRHYYVYESSSMAVLENFPDYMKRAHQVLAAEVARVQLYLPPNTQSAVIAMCAEAVVGPRRNFVYIEFTRLLENDHFEGACSPPFSHSHLVGDIAH